jgi:hypothetical protein
MPNDDSKSTPRDANSAAAPISERFNQSNDLETQISTLSATGQRECRAIQTLSEERLESEIDSQKRSHGYRVMKEQVKRLEDYVRQPAPRPPGILHDPTNDLNIIREQSEKTVRDREAHFQDRIRKEAVANVKLVVARERKGQQPERDNHEHEQGH